MARDYYEILGVSKSADKKEIKKAYRKLAMKYHPDRNPGDKSAEIKFKEAAEAYDVLSDEQKKSRYDQFGHAGVNGQQGFGGAGGMNMEDIFSQFGDIFGGGGFDSFFSGRGGGGRRATGQRGTNLRVKISLDLNDIANGVTKKIKVKKQVKCNTCNGSGAKDSSSVKTCSTCQGHGQVRQIRTTFLGQMQTTTTCPSCNGSGSTITASCSDCKGEGKNYGEETIEVKIPAGVSDGMQLSLRGKGNAGAQGGPAGDLLIRIEEKEHDQLTRDGSNLIHELYINFADAALGTSIEVPTINGKVKIKVPAGTQSGKMFRLKGKGLPSVEGYGIGDQLIHINIWTPKSLTREEKDLMEKLKSMKNFDPKPSKNDKGFFDKMKDYFN